MKMILNVSSILAIALGAALYAAPVAAAPVSCGTAVNGYLDNTSGISWLAVTGGRVTARNGWGFSSFVMDDYFQIETHPLHTPAAAPQSHFQALRNSSSNFNGFFHEVFPERGNGDEDRWQFWVGRNGLFYLRSITWNGSWQLMQNAVCYTGPGGTIVVTGQFDNAGYGLDFWTFLMAGIPPIE